ncbi:acyltransferase [Streptomyces sp. NPDC021562]|uniref:acyltransferase family protein n=1 Tax=Streptomyces sp. NPDC021562 TaxID=3155121 RepID=UPI00104A49F5
MSLATSTTTPSPAKTAVVPVPSGRPRPRLLALDGLRLLAALMVCLYHYTGRGGVVSASWHQNPAHIFPTLSRAAVYGNLGVEFFFVISGFVICMSSWGRSLGDFFRSRVARLYPAYWVALLLVTGASLVLPAVVHAVRFDEFLVNLTMLQQPMGVPRVLGVCWTLWVEVRFYALFALTVVLPGVTYRRVVLFCSVWTLATVLSTAAGGPWTELVVMPQYAPYFIGGLALYLVHRFGNQALPWGIVALSWILGLRMASEGAWHHGSPRDPYVVMLVVTLAYAAVAAVAAGWTRWAAWPWLTTAGALTYPFYLIHEHLGWFAIRVLHRSWGLPAWPTLAITVCTMLGLAWLIHRFVETPIGPRLKRALKSPPRTTG